MRQFQIKAQLPNLKWKGKFSFNFTTKKRLELVEAQSKNAFTAGVWRSLCDTLKLHGLSGRKKVFLNSLKCMNFNIIFFAAFNSINCSSIIFIVHECFWYEFTLRLCCCAVWEVALLVKCSKKLEEALLSWFLNK